MLLCLGAGCATPASSGDDGGPDASSETVDGAAPDASPPFDAGTGADNARLVVLSRDGRAASLDVAAPWTLRASADLGADTASVRCRGMRCLVAHPTPSDTVDLIDARDLHRIFTFVLADGADPRDALWIDDQRALVSQRGRAELLAIDVTSRETSPIDLSALADADGLPESGRIASCGSLAYVQLARTDQGTGAPSPLGAALAVIDLDRPSGDRVVDVDASVPGIQGIPLARAADFDMPIDCAGGTLFVAEPAPLFSGGGAYEQVDLTAYAVSEYPIDNGAQVGGFEVVTEGIVWRITHTDFGPGASSHLELVGGATQDTYNTFSGEHVDELALDRVEDLLFFPDPCVVTPSNQACRPGVHAFHAHTGFEASTTAIGVGFEPIELAIARAQPSLR